MLCKVVEKLVFSNVNSLDLLPLIALVLFTVFEQAKDFIRVTRKVFRKRPL